MTFLLICIFYIFGFTALVFEPLYYFGCWWQMRNCSTSTLKLVQVVGKIWDIYNQWDPMFNDIPSWLRVMCAIEVFLFGPLYIVCAYGLQQKAEWLPKIALPFCGALVYSTLVYFTMEYIELLPETNMTMVVLVNIPWTIFPLLMISKILESTTATATAIRSTESDTDRRALSYSPWKLFAVLSLFACMLSACSLHHSVYIMTSSLSSSTVTNATVTRTTTATALAVNMCSVQEKNRGGRGRRREDGVAPTVSSGDSSTIGSNNHSAEGALLSALSDVPSLLKTIQASIQSNVVSQYSEHHYHSKTTTTPTPTSTAATAAAATSSALSQHANYIGTVIDEILAVFDPRGRFGKQCHSNNNNNNNTNIISKSAHEYKVNRISDSFFTNLSGASVTNADYGYIQLCGPDGAPFHHRNVRFGISFQGPGLKYLGHHHVAQELYTVLNGSAHWWTDRRPFWEKRQYSFHLSNEHHAMYTVAAAAVAEDNAIDGTLFFWSWTGDIKLDIRHSPPDI